MSFGDKDGVGSGRASAAVASVTVGAAKVGAAGASMTAKAAAAAYSSLEHGVQQYHDHKLGAKLEAKRKEGHPGDLLARELGDVCLLAIAGFDGEINGLGNEVGKFIHAFSRTGVVDPIRIGLVAATMEKAIMEKIPGSKNRDAPGCCAPIYSLFSKCFKCCCGAGANAKNRNRTKLTEDLAFSMGVLANSKKTAGAPDGKSEEDLIMVRACLFVRACVFQF